MKWSEEELYVLYKDLPVSKLAELLPGRSEDAIRSRKAKLGIVSRARWTESEKRILQEKFGEVRKEEMCELLPGRSWESIMSKASRLRAMGWNIGKYKGR